MKIGLVRHFEVNHPFSSEKWLTHAEVSDWLIKYDTSDIRLGSKDVSGIKWNICYSSDLPRAFNTASHIYEGTIEKTELLREINIYPFTKARIRLPHRAWIIIGRFAWLVSHRSQLEGKAQTMKRVREFVSHILCQDQSNILVVSHGGLMWYLRGELIRNGFKGDSFIKAENGKLYIFEK